LLLNVAKKNKCPPTPLIQEVELLKLVRGHDSVVQLLEVYESKTKINMVMEFICGGELFDKIVELEAYSETDAAKLFRQIVEGVKYCHALNIVHRDLKPENLMFADEEATVLKLIDFGVSALISNDNDLLYDRVGTRTYMAPEISKLTGYGKPCDMYSLGVILYILLVGYPPFDEEEGITDLEFPSPDWDGVSQEVISVVRNLLHEEPTNRMSINDLSSHPWVSGRRTSDLSLKRKGTIHSLRLYNSMRKMNASINASKSNKRISVFGMFGLEEEKKQIKKARGSLCLSDEDLKKRIKEEIKDINELFEILTEDFMALSLRCKEVDKREYILKKSRRNR